MGIAIFQSGEQRAKSSRRRSTACEWIRLRLAGAMPAGEAASRVGANGGLTGIGIDIQRVAKLPVAADYRTDPFYQANFSAEEIAYCICQADARLSFCGHWAAKEAIVKTMRNARDITDLSAIRIEHDLGGRPVYSSGNLSISHDDDICVSVFAASVVESTDVPSVPNVTDSPARVSPPRRHFFEFLAAAVILAAFVALYIVHPF
jgi:phosphopantetheine--protein transferase-like protein